MTLLQIYWWIKHWKNFENRFVFGEVTDKSPFWFFFGSQCISSLNNELEVTIDWIQQSPIAAVHTHPGSEVSAAKNSVNHSEK